MSISVLHSFEHIDDALDWEVGVHGLTIEIDEDGQLYRGTFLPNVAPEQGYNRAETLDHLVNKAHYEGVFEDVKDIVDFWRYQSVYFEMTYEEWIEKLQ